MAERQQYSLISQALPRALFVFLKTLLYFIFLPYRIWKGSTLRLAGLSNQSMIKDEEEFPVSTFFKIALDAVIMILPILGILIPVIAILVVPNAPYSSYYLQEIYYQYSYNVWVLFTPFLFSYLLIPLISWFKEILTIFLEMIHRLEEIEKNTRISK